MNTKVLSFTLILTFLTTDNQFFSQNSNGINITPKLAINTYLEAYYGYDFSEPKDNLRPDVLYNYTDHNTINVNAGIIGVNYKGNFIRGDLAFIAGTYADQNLSHEPQFYKHVYQASVGVKLLKRHDLWLDFGIMESNLGFENVRANECFTMTRSLLAESSPFYLNAAKLSYITLNKKWEAELLFSNGWQEMIDGFPSFGHTLKYKPTDEWLINSSSFVGRVKAPGIVPNTTRKEFRVFHNFYLKYENDKMGFIGGIDFGIDHLVNDHNNVGSWAGIIAVYKYKFNKRWSSAVRGEYFLDPSSSVAKIDNKVGFDNFGASVNLDYQLGQMLMFRIEGRILTGKEEYYMLHQKPAQSNFYLGAAANFHLWKQ